MVVSSGGGGSCFVAGEDADRLVMLAPTGLCVRKAGWMCFCVVVEFGVAERGVSAVELFRNGGAHSSCSMRWTGRRRDRMDWTGGPRGGW